MRLRSVYHSAEKGRRKGEKKRRDRESKIESSVEEDGGSNAIWESWSRSRVGVGVRQIEV